MLTTRIGVNSKMIITGDLKQTDIPNNNGLEDLIERINKYNNKTNNSLHTIKIVTFEKQDIERSDIVKDIINIYEYAEKTINNNNTTGTINYINNTTNKNTTSIKIKHYNDDNDDNDAALIPKQHISKNYDIFFDNPNF